VSNIRLEGQHQSFVIALEFWDELLQWAEENDWKPQHAPACYRQADGLEISAADAANLADALEVIAGEMVLYDTLVSERFLKELGDGFMKLIAFFQSGAFRICDILGPTE
jgi:hypothetical protein